MRFSPFFLSPSTLIFFRNSFHISIFFSFPWRNRAPRPLLPPNVTAPRAALLQHA